MGNIIFILNFEEQNFIAQKIRQIHMELAILTKHILLLKKQKCV
jgi:hypothetical protein